MLSTPQQQFRPRAWAGGTLYLAEQAVSQPRVATAGGNCLAVPAVAASWIVVVVLGSVEGVFGRAIYLNDYISYLDVSRAIPALDWREIFNPMWSPGYPLLVALARGMAPPTTEGEWYATALLNLLIALGAYAAWRYLIRNAITFYRPASAEMANYPLAVWTTLWLFVGCCLVLVYVSSVWPDLLVTAYFVLASGLSLRLIRRGGVREAIALGLVLGTGVWIKGAFLAFSTFFLLVILINCCLKQTRWRSLGIIVTIYLPLLMIYIAAISWSYGELTFGATGALNYAFHVNHLPHWYHWRGGPAPFGTPIHPTRQLLPDLPVFGFATPFRTTYPPYANLAYWYQGFHQFHDLRLQLEAIARSAYHLAQAIKGQPILTGIALALLIPLAKPEWREGMWTAVRYCWPLLVPTVLALGAYLLVSIEERYLAPFALIFGLLALAPLLDPKLPARRTLAAALIAVITIAGVTQYARNAGTAVSHALHADDFRDHPQWKLAAALSAHGLKKDDAVAIVDGFVAQPRYHWAYVNHLRIVAEFGALPWHIAPRERTPFDGDATEPADQDYGQLFWLRLTPAQRAAVIEAFRSTGARAIVSLSNPRSSPEAGWTPLSGTNAWLYEFPR
jgi:hypothetical protein